MFNRKTLMIEFVECQAIVKLGTLTTGIGLAMAQAQEIIDLVVAEGAGHLFDFHMVLANLNNVQAGVLDSSYGGRRKQPNS